VRFFEPISSLKSNTTLDVTFLTFSGSLGAPSSGYCFSFSERTVTSLPSPVFTTQGVLGFEDCQAWSRAYSGWSWSASSNLCHTWAARQLPAGLPYVPAGKDSYVGRCNGTCENMNALLCVKNPVSCTDLLFFYMPIVFNATAPPASIAGKVSRAPAGTCNYVKSVRPVSPALAVPTIYDYVTSFAACASLGIGKAAFYHRSDQQQCLVYSASHFVYTAGILESAIGTCTGKLTTVNDHHSMTCLTLYSHRNCHRCLSQTYCAS
jgi:hypothetical protein